MHLDLDQAVAFAGLAAAALDVEAEAAGLIATRARFRHAGEQFADRREQLRVGCGVRTRRPADRRLVDVDDLVELVNAVDAIAQRMLCRGIRSEEHTSELQSLMRISYAVFCVKKKKNQYRNIYQKNIDR